MSIKDIATDEMIVDYQECVYEISAFIAGLEINRETIAAITTELVSRGVDIRGIKKIEYPLIFEYDGKIKT